MHIGEDGSLKMGDGVDFDGPSLTVDGELDMNGQDAKLGSLGGDGTVSGDGHLDIEGGEGDFSGDFTGSGSITVTGDETHQSFTDAEGPSWDLEVKDGGRLSLTESTFHDVEAKKDGNLEFRAKGAGAKDAAGANVHLTGNLIFRNGSTTMLTLNMNADELWKKNRAMMVSADGAICIERQAGFKINALQEEMPEGRGGDLTNIVVMKGNEIHVADEFPDVIGVDLQNLRAGSESLNVSLTGLFSLYYENPTLTVLGNEVLMSARYNEKAPGNNDNNTTGALEERTKDLGGGSTAQAGAGLLDHADLTSDPTLSAVGNALGNMLASGNSTGALKLMAAVAGGTVTSLGAAQRDATRGEMNRVLSRVSQNRWWSTAARIDQDQEYRIVTPQKGGAAPHAADHQKLCGIPVYAWIEGNGDFRRLSSEGELSGYRLSSWGGTVGAAVAPSRDVLLGLALSAQYGDLEASAADSAKGDLDGYYLSLLAHVQNSAWGHTFTATLGRHEATLNRVVDYGEGSYATHGSTRGSAYGLAYELSYDLPLAEDKRSILQPLASVSLVSSSMDGYAEQGAGGAGLSVGRQKWCTSSVAVGARWLAQLNDSVFGKTAHTELHVALAQDMGDSQGCASVALQANPGYSRQVQGAEIGRTSLQLGAGLALPVADSKQLYFYTQADLRSGSASWNIGSGLRMAF